MASASNSLIVGPGARRHVLAQRLLAESEDARVWCTSGIPNHDDIRLLTAPQFNRHTDICRWALREGIELAIVASEKDLCRGLADGLRQAGIATFGPSAAAARIESNRPFAKELFAQCKIKTPSFEHFSTLSSATLALPSLSFPCYGKVANPSPSSCVELLRTVSDAASWLQRIAPSVSANGIIFEEQCVGTEFSVTAFTDGNDVVISPRILGYKKAYEGNDGPNTGGMGACCPCPTSGTPPADWITDDVFRRIVAGLAEQGCPFRGALTADFVQNELATWLLECNCHLGDPEISTIAAVFDSRLTDVLHEVAVGSISNFKPAWKQGSAIAVTIAASDYPEEPERKIRVPDLDDCQDFFWYDVEESQQGEVFSGGRLLSVCAFRPSLVDARTHVYSLVDDILSRFPPDDFQAVRVRRDIGLF